MVELTRCRSIEQEYSRRERITCVPPPRWPQATVDVVVRESGREAEFSGHHAKRLAGGLFRAANPPKKVVHGLLKGRTRSPPLFLQQTGYVVIEGNCGSHIMMLYREAS